jgi:ribosome biogenesis GTPase A
MAKATRQVSEKLKLIDIAIELVDARLPYSSHNPMLDELVKKKPRLIVLNKKDLADPQITRKWIKFYRQSGLHALPINAQTGEGVNKIYTVCQELAQLQLYKRIQKGMQSRPIRALIMGIPNVGKSSLINRLAKRQATRTGDRPGLTKGEQWIRTKGHLELLDTPGILWPKFDDKQVGLKLAASGAIRDEILPIEEVALFALEFIRERYAERLVERYKVTQQEGETLSLLEEIGKARGCLKGGGQLDLEKTSELFLHDLRTGKLGPISFEQPEEFA